MYYLYILKCNDGTLYTGITTDINRRIEEHNGKAPGGAKYTRTRRPVELIFQRSFPNRSLASKEEHAIKQLSRTGKEDYITTRTTSSSKTN